MGDQETARQIAEDLLTRTGAALLSGDYPAFAACFLRPVTTETFAGQRIVQTQAEHRAMFDEVVEYYRMNNVSDLVRQVISAEFQEDRMIFSTHTARCLSGSQILSHSTNCLSRIRFSDGLWRIDMMRYASENAARFDAAITGHTPGPSGRRPLH